MSGLGREPSLIRPSIVLRATRTNPRNVGFFHCRDPLDAKPKRYENMLAFLEATRQSHASAPMVYEIDTQRSYNN